MPERIGLVAELDLTQFDRAVGSYIRSVNRMERATHNVADSMIVAYARLGGVIATTVGGIAAAVGGIAVSGGQAGMSWLEEGIEDAVDFEQQMHEIAAVMVKTRQEIEPLAQEINRLALDPDLVVSAEEAGAMVEQLARNGVEMSDILDGAARSSILLANATGGDFAMAADVATMAMHMFGMEAENLNRIADVSQQVINSTRIELDDWKLALGNGGAVAANYGITIEEFAATIEATINSFHSARQAGTSMMNFVQRLVPITKVAADEMKKLGLFTGLSDEEFEKISQEIAETEQRIADLDPRLVHYDELVEAHTKHAAELRAELVKGKNAFFDEHGEMKEWGEVANTLIEATKDLSQEEKAEAFRRIFGNDAMETAIKLSQMSADELSNLAKSYESTGQAQKAAETRTDTLAKRWENLKDIWDSIRRLSGEKFIGMLRNMVERLTVLTNQNQNRVIDFFGRMAELLNRIVDAAMPWVERMLPIFIDNIEALAHWLVELVLKGDKTEEWFSRMHPALQRFLQRIFDIVAAGRQFINWVTDVAKAVRRALDPFVDWITENVTFKDALYAAAGAVVAFLAPLALLIARMAAAGLIAARAISNVRRAWTEDWNGIRTIFNTVWPKIQGPLISFINNFLMGRWVRAWNDAVKVVVTALSEIEKYVPDFFKPFLRLINSILLGNWGNAFDNMLDVVRNVFNAIKIGLDRLSHPFTDFILRILEGRWLEAWTIFQRTAVNVLNFLTQRLPVFFKPFTSFIANVLEGDWENAWNDAQQIVLNVYNAIVAGLDWLNLPFTNFISNLLKGDWAAAWGQVKNFALGAFELIKDELKKLNNPFTDFIVDILEGNWVEVWDTIKDAAEFAYKWIVDKLYGFGNRVTSFLANILTGKWHEVWKDIREGAEFAYRWIIEKLYSFGNGFTTFLANVLSGKWKEAWDQLREAAVFTLTWLRDRLPVLLTPLFDTLIALVEGRWLDAWNHARTFVIEVLEEIREFFGGGFISDMIDILINFVEGDWSGMWFMIRSVAIQALEWIRDNFLPTLLDPLADMLIHMINGDWARAWHEAKKFVIGVRDYIVDWLDNFDNDFAGLAQNILTGNWAGAWENAKRIVLLARDLIVDWLTNFDNPFSQLAQNLLTGNWAGAWENAKTIVLAARDFIVDWLTNFDNPFSELAQNLLTGNWAGAWENAKEIVSLARDKIVDFLTNFDNPFSELAQNLLTGNWNLAWENAKEIVRLAKDWIVEKLLGMDNDFAKLAGLILSGNWSGAWTQAQNIATQVFETIITELEALDSPFADFVVDVLEGRWGEAWEAVDEYLFGEQGLLSVKLPNALRGLDSPFASFVADILEGRWGDAWGKVDEFLFGDEGLLSAKLPNALRDLDTPFANFVADILEGQWGTAWQTAYDFLFGEAGLISFKLPQGLRDLDTPFANFVADILEGKWGPAWETVYDYLLGDEGLLSKKLPDAIRGLDSPVGDFIADVIEGKWGPAWTAASGWAILKLQEVKDYVPEFALPFIDFMQHILKEEWQLAWLDVQTIARTALDHVLFIFSQFQGKFLGIVGLVGLGLTLLEDQFRALAANEETPEWLARVLLLAAEVGSALGNVSGAIGDFINMLTTLAGVTDTEGQKTLVFLRFIALAADAAALSVRLFINYLTMMAQFARGGFNPLDENFLASVAKQQELIKELQDNFARGGTTLDEMFPGLNAEPDYDALDVHRLLFEFNQFKSTVQTLGAEFAVQMGVFGSMGLQGFAERFVGDGSGEAQAAVGNFVQDMLYVAKGIEDGMYVEGSKAVEALVVGIAEKYGIASGAALGLSTNIIDAYQRHMGIEGPPKVSQSLEQTFVDPMVGLDEKAAELSAKIGTTTMTGMSDGANAASSIPQETWKSIYDQLIASGQIVPENMSETARIAVEKLGTGTELSKEDSLALWDLLAGDIIATQSGLPTSMETTGSAAVEGMDRGAGSKTPTSLEMWRQYYEETLNRIKPLPDNMLELGESSSINLGTGLEDKKQPTLTIFDLLREDSAGMISPLETDMKNIGINSATNLGTEIGTVGTKEMTVNLAKIALLSEIWGGKTQLFWQEEGDRQIKEYATAIILGGAYIQEAFGVLGDRVFIPWATETLTFMTHRGDQSMSNFGDGIRGGIHWVESAAREAGMALRTEIGVHLDVVVAMFKNLSTRIQVETDFNQFNIIGQQIGNGIKAGIDSTAQAVEASATGLINQAATGVETQAQIASPSQLFRELGGYTGEGFLLGWEDQLVKLTILLSQHMKHTEGMMHEYGLSLRKAAKAMYDIINFDEQVWVEKLSKAAGVSATAGATLRDFANAMQAQMQSNTQKQLAYAASTYNPGVANNYATSNTSSVSFGPIYVNDKMDGAELIYKVQQIIDGKRPI